MINRLMRRVALGAMIALAATPASAELVLSQLVVELGAGKEPRSDIEIWNNDKEQAFVVVQPSEIVGAGTAAEQRVSERNPETLGLLVSPARLILEPGQHKLLRVATIGALPVRERVYRITVKPTVGDITANRSGLKLLIGYDLLVLVRPAAASPRLVASHAGGQLVIRNEGASSVELAGGKSCRGKTDCTVLGGKRLYAGAEWRVAVPDGAPAEFTVIGPDGTRRQTF
jgi:P pilus assembly chaperone PapD